MSVTVGGVLQTPVVRRWAVAVAGILVAGCWAHAVIDDSTPTDAGPSAARTPDAKSLPGPPPDAWAAAVLRVIDGDTILVRIHGHDTRVRLIGVDAPETWLRRDCYGAEAVRALRRLAPPGSTLRAAGDVEPYDRYRRRLVYLWTADGVFVDALLVREGFARAMVVPPDTRYAAVLREAEDAARRSHAGLWRACP